MVHMLAALPSPVCVRGWYVKNVWSRAKRKSKDPSSDPGRRARALQTKIELNLRLRARPLSITHLTHTNFHRQDSQSVARPGRARFALRCVRGMRKAVRERRAYPTRGPRYLSTRRGAPRGGGGRGRRHTLVASAALIFTELFLRFHILEVCVCADTPTTTRDLRCCSCWPGQSRPAAARLGGGATRCGCRLLEFRDQ